MNKPFLPQVASAIGCFLTTVTAMTKADTVTKAAYKGNHLLWGPWLQKVSPWPSWQGGRQQAGGMVLEQ